MLLRFTPACRAIAVAALTFLATSVAHAQGKVTTAPLSGGHNVANEQAYARAVMADPAPPSNDDAEHGNSQFYRHLRYEYKMPVKFIWTESAAQQLTEKRDLELWTVIENISTDLARSLGGSRAEYYTAPVRKIKEIHFSTTDLVDPSWPAAIPLPLLVFGMLFFTLPFWAEVQQSRPLLVNLLQLTPAADAAGLTA